ncbi:acyl carrier protein [Streptomyces platensis]|uniref:acyl carrier protein n=1 Tax=Streptomyces platensis TaxID=58346 RepID=UPI00386858A5|nr:acyl carrier protein [Streptomyces platensis]
MTEMTLNDLRRILTTCAGEVDAADPAGDILDTPFEDLGYDSLARMESAAVIEREYGVAVADERIAEAPTPRALLDVVNSALAAAA